MISIYQQNSHCSAYSLLKLLSVDQQIDFLILAMLAV